MKSYFKRSILVPVLLLIYLIVMAVIGWPHYASTGRFLEFTAIIVATLVVIVVLFFLLRRRDRMRDRMKRQKVASYRRNIRNDDIR